MGSNKVCVMTFTFLFDWPLQEERKRLGNPVVMKKKKHETWVILQLNILSNGKI